MTAEMIANALSGRRVGEGYIARCPAHDDHNPSLSITEKDGKILVKCFAGCEQRDVIAALQERGIWKSRPTRRDPVLPLYSRIVCAYDYTDEGGRLLYQIVRLHSPKDFLQRYPNGAGGWIWKKHSRQVLYRLPEVTEASIVLLVEGEKDVETLRSYGFVATTNAGGANSPWLDSYTDALRGREVIFIPDNDDPGIKRGKHIARALLGHAARLVWWELERAKDITEWFEHGHSELELIASIPEPNAEDVRQ